MNQDDELTRRFHEVGQEAMASAAPAGAEAVRETVRHRRRVRAAAAGVFTVALLAVGGTWLGVRLAGSAGPPAPVGAGNTASNPSTVAAPAPAEAVPDTQAAPGGPDTPAGTGTVKTEAAGPAQPPRCHTGDLAGQIDQSAGGMAAGSVYLDLGLTNRSSHPCRIYGFPGMALVDSSGKWLPTKVRRDQAESRLITLAPGQTAWATIHYAHVPADDEGFPCQPAAVGLVVTPPDETSQLTVRAKLDDVCQHGQIATSPMKTERSK